MASYSIDEAWKLYSALPQSLRNTILSSETAEIISRIAERNKLDESQEEILSQLVGEILLGILSPQELAISLQEEGNFSPQQAQDVSREVVRFILYPLKDDLAILYNDITLAPGGRIFPKEESSQAQELVTSNKDTVKVVDTVDVVDKKTTKPRARKKQVDIYREPID